MSDNSEAASSGGEWEHVEEGDKEVLELKADQEAELVKCRQELEEERERWRRLNEEVEKMRAEVANMKVVENKDKEEKEDEDEVEAPKKESVKEAVKEKKAEEPKILLQKVDVLLESLTEANKVEVFKEFGSYDASTSGYLEEIINNIISKAVYNPDLVPLYVELCEYQIDNELYMNVGTPMFHTALLDNIKRRFIGQSHDEAFKSGITAFIARMYSLGVAKVEIIFWCINDLLQPGIYSESPLSPSNECNIQCVIRMLMDVGELVERYYPDTFLSGKDFLDRTMTRLHSLAQHCSVKTSCMCARLAMRRVKNWVPQDLIPGPAINIRMNLDEESAAKVTETSSEDVYLWKQILSEFGLKVVSGDKFVPEQEGAADEKSCEPSTPSVNNEGEGWEKYRKFLSSFHEGNNVQTDELPEIEENMLYLKPWMAKEVAQVDKATQALRVERRNLYQQIRQLEKIREKTTEQGEKEEYGSAIEKLAYLSRKVSASVLSNNFSHVLELNLFLPQDFKDVDVSGDSGEVNFPMVLEEKIDTTPWMNEEYQRVEESIGELKDKAMMIYTGKKKRGRRWRKNCSG